jgi:hypothetical protein
MWLILLSFFQSTRADMSDRGNCGNHHMLVRVRFLDSVLATIYIHGKVLLPSPEVIPPMLMRQRSSKIVTSMPAARLRAQSESRPKPLNYYSRLQPVWFLKIDRHSLKGVCIDEVITQL